jgi:hypothetical protein
LDTSFVVPGANHYPTALSLLLYLQTLQPLMLLMLLTSKVDEAVAVAGVEAMVVEVVEAEVVEAEAMVEEDVEAEAMVEEDVEAEAMVVEDVATVEEGEVTGDTVAIVAMVEVDADVIGQLKRKTLRMFHLFPFLFDTKAEL